MTDISAAPASFIDTVLARRRALKLDPACSALIGRREFGVGHALEQHPLLSLEAIAQLADALPAAAVECHRARQPLLLPGGVSAGDAEPLAKPSEIVRNIDTSGRWMVLWNIEQRAPYRKLLNELLDEVVRLLPTRERGMVFREAFLFISSPGSITPAHIDPEHNFLLQLRGKKDMHVGSFASPAIEQGELTRYNDSGHRNIAEMPLHSSTFSLLAGDGVYLPPWRPHWVNNGPQASLSLSVTFRTGLSQQVENAHRFNAKLRRWGIAPPPVGESPFTDRLKAAFIGGKSWLKRGGRPLRGARDFS
ncbi:MAG: hypothetical protein RLZZ227_1112 [Pseudomonadota bacterium]